MRSKVTPKQIEIIKEFYKIEVMYGKSKMTEDEYVAMWIKKLYE